MISSIQYPLFPEYFEQLTLSRCTGVICMEYIWSTYRVHILLPFWYAHRTRNWSQPHTLTGEPMDSYDCFLGSSNPTLKTPVTRAMYPLPQRNLTLNLIMYSVLRTYVLYHQVPDSSNPTTSFCIEAGFPQLA